MKGVADIDSEVEFREPLPGTNHKEYGMTTEEKVARRKLSLLELASKLSNVSRTCDGLQPPAVLRDSPPVPDRWERLA